MPQQPTEGQSRLMVDEGPGQASWPEKELLLHTSPQIQQILGGGIEGAPTDTGDAPQIDAPPIVQQDEMRIQTPGRIRPGEIHHIQQDPGCPMDANPQLHGAWDQLHQIDGVTDGGTQTFDLRVVFAGRP